MAEVAELARLEGRNFRGVETRKKAGTHVGVGLMFRRGSY
jgi:hypothetical protein